LYRSSLGKLGSFILLHRSRYTDLHAAHGDWPVQPAPRFIPGHEGIGLVAAVGPGVTIVKEDGGACGRGQAFSAGGSRWALLP
jgi:NADPH:quinone reductase-like Zn-dependent oxidoreductase